MMTEKQFIEGLKKIKERCQGIGCGECPFGMGDCQLRVIATQLDVLPIDWNIEEMEKLINE